MWFNGTVTEAIVKTKAEKSLLIIFVYGNDEKSKTGIECWENEEIQNVCRENNCVALKFAENSQEARQFAEFYPLVCIPISFFIGNDGKPIETIVEHVNIDLLKSNLLKSAAAVSKEKSTTLKNTSENLPCSSSADDVKQLMKELHEKRLKQAAEAEKDGELKRREEGKIILNAKDKQRQLELQAAVEERKRDKKADEERLKRLREQIAADRAEKKERFETTKNEQNKENTEKIESKKSVKEAEEAKKRENDEELRKKTRLQFRLPDGGAVYETFESKKLFRDVFQFIDEKLKLNGKFHLVQMYPRREFSGADMEKNLLDLDLTPSAVLMVLMEGKNRSHDVQRYDNRITWFLSLLTLPFITVYNFLYDFIFPGVTATTANSKTSENRQNSKKSQENFGRQEGNVHRMPAASESDKPADDNATWNGNSTQQM